ncbi:unnamed protein product [Angiostrongylus costaricensis]|uniref:F-box domain-containing protein n=1 Tax=Angiostrongylus costaricensis TaxID=334426 RepID=A0A158PK37_ANGCS|nr:unnamed protein product [Angiostrongylus costaricensis]
MRRRCVIPSLPDVVLRHIFSFLNYRLLCKAESVCRRWKTAVKSLIRYQIHEIIIERFGASSPSVHELMAFRRLSINCPIDAFDFLAGVLRRSRSSLTRMTVDIKLLANLKYVRVDKEERRKYFSNVEDLWLLIVDCNDEVTTEFLCIEGQLFTDILNFTLQVHIMPNYYDNVAMVVNALISRHSKASIQLELHAPTSSMVFSQLLGLHSLCARRIKIICTEFNLPSFCFSRLYTVMKEHDIRTKNLVVRDWTILVDASSPIIAYPVDTLRISSCTIESVDDLVGGLRVTINQVRHSSSSSSSYPVHCHSLVLVTTVLPKETLYVKKLEIAGQCTLRGLQFLQNKAHIELEKRLKIAVPDVEVDFEEIYYCW